MRNLSIIGSTGSIGVQTLEICRELPELFNVEAISCGTNIDLFEKQIYEFRPKLAAVKNESDYKILKERIKTSETELCFGEDGISDVADYFGSDTLIAAIVGMAGLNPVYKAIKKGRRICLANKEVLVSAGSLVMKKIKELDVELLPIDSEHSAIFQSLAGDIENLEKIILTASGGPFRGFSEQEIKEVTLEKALKHPNWEMGKKITIDSATLMNKGLEVIEARWLFEVKPEMIEVVVHPESIIHSMVQFKDGSIIGQMGLPDMKLPIRYSLSWPERLKSNYERLDFLKNNSLTFEKPNLKVFKCLKLAYDALNDSDASCVVLNGANEAVVAAYLDKKLKFNEIPEIIETILNMNKIKKCITIEEIHDLDIWARRETEILVSSISKEK